MDRGLAPAHGGVVHDVVVQQREVVEHLDGRSRGQRLLHVVGEDAAGERQQHGAEAFAAPGERIADRGVEEFRFGRKFGLGEVIFDGGEHLLVGLHSLE